jgi:outer membrane protein OmpA-like peptidoglycan-associated protein
MMRIWLLGGVAFAAMCSSAYAQQATGLYVSAGVGANWLSGGNHVEGDADTFGFDGPERFPTGSFSFEGRGHDDYDVGPVGVAAVGYDWGMFRAEAELGIRNNDLGHFKGTGDFDRRGVQALDVGIGVGGDGFSYDVSTGHVRTISAMANALLDFDLGPVTIYGGGGLGLANVELNLEGSSDFDTLLAYQGIAGAAYNITPQLAVTAEYRYFATFDDPSFHYEASTAPVDFDARVKLTDFANQSALIGIRYTFAPPAPAAQEVVQARSYLVFFDFDSSQLTPDAQSIVATAAADALKGGSPRLDVTGHTDRSGSDAYNQALSIRRATSVQNALIANGVPADLIVIRGAGESEPLVPTADGVREPQNRRVEIVIN